jgi:hypothetical protein
MRGGAREEKWQLKGACQDMKAAQSARTCVPGMGTSANGGDWTLAPSVAASNRGQS